MVCVLDFGSDDEDSTIVVMLIRGVIIIRGRDAYQQNTINVLYV